MTDQKRNADLATAEELLAWSASFDSEARAGGIVSTDNRKFAVAMIEQAKSEALLTHHRGGHRGTERRKLMPWEIEREEHIQELIEASLRGRFTQGVSTYVARLV